MDRHLEPTIGGFNDFLAEQRQGDGLCLLTLTKFEGRNFRTPYTDLDLRMAPDLTPNTFVPGGGTPLRDAIVQRICAMRERLKTWDIKPNVLFVVMTDGEDNQSIMGEQAVRTQIEMALGEGWVTLFYGAHARAEDDARRLGFPPGNIKSFAAAKMRETFRDLSKVTSAFRASAVPSGEMKSNDWVDPYHRRLHNNANFFDGR